MKATIGWSQLSRLGNSLPADTIADPWLGAEPTIEGTKEIATAAEIVKIVEFADFGCHACQAWHKSGIREQILAEYGDQVRFVWKDFPVITAQSPQAAEAGHCAAAQGKFWEYHDYVYENQVGLGRAELEGYAEATNLNIGAFNQYLDEKTMALKVQANEQEARQAGMRGTPGFMANGRNLGGPPSYDMLVSLISQELQTN